MQRVLAIWLPNWPLQRLLSNRPELRGQPVVLEALSRRGQCVAACSPEAEVAGVQLGMPTAEAVVLMRSAPVPSPSRGRLGRGARRVHGMSPSPAAPGSARGSVSIKATVARTQRDSRAEPGAVGGTGPQKTLFAYDPGADRAALEQLAKWCHRFSPTTGIESGDPPETILLDATNLAPLYGSEELLVAQVLQGFRRLGLEVRLALASTLGAAWALAHSTSWEGEAPAEPRSGYTVNGERVPGARLGGSLALPAVPSGDTQTALAPLPIAALRLDDSLLETLASLGVERIGEVLTLPRDQLRSRFGPQLLLRVDQALGAASEVFAAVEPPEEFVVEQLFEYPQTSRETLHYVIDSLLKRLGWMLANRCAGALRIACRFECEGTPPVELEIGLFQPTANPRHLLEIFELEMERLRLRAPAMAVSLRVLRHAPLAERQGVLFDEPRNLESSFRLAGLVDRLAGRLGREAVVRCYLAREAQPELGYVEHPLVDGVHRSSPKPTKTRRSPATTARTQPTLGALDRPLYLLRRPAPLEAISVAPDGPPIQFRRGGRQHIVARNWGPERIETGWWRSRSIWRDYYRVETAAGERYWLYRRRHDGRWFLHGVFG